MVMGTPCSGPRSPPPGGRLVGGGRLGQGLLAAELDHGVEGGVDGLDPGQQGLGQLTGGELPVAQPPGHLGRRQQQDVAHGMSTCSVAVRWHPPVSALPREESQAGRGGAQSGT